MLRLVTIDFIILRHLALYNAVMVTKKDNIGTVEQKMFNQDISIQVLEYDPKICPFGTPVDKSKQMWF